MNNIRKLTSRLAFRIIGFIVCLLLVYNLIVQTIGYFQFTESLTNEYNDSASGQRRRLLRWWMETRLKNIFRPTVTVMNTGID
jgi:hypothetical protein